jgi:hypothetical protein
MELRVTGERQVAASLRALVAAADTDTLKDAARYASEPIVTAAKGRAPSEDIADGIRVLNVDVTASGEVVSEIGLPGGRQKWFHGLFVELGTGPRVQKTTGRRTGSMPASPFLRPAFMSERAAASRRFFAYLRERVMGARRG